MSESIRLGLRMMDAVLTYGVDGLADQNAQAALLKDLGLDPDVFFRELYVNRPATEDELLAQMDSGCLHTFVVGPIGCGKTTLLHHVIRQYCGDRRLPILLIDMKTASIAKPDIYSIAQRIEEDCKKQIALFLSTYRINADGTPAASSVQPDIQTLAMILLEPQNHGFVSPQRFGPIHQLQTMYGLSGARKSGVSLTEWIVQHVDEPTENEIKRILTTFILSLGLVECAFAISELSKREISSARRSKLVIAVDNLDAIEDPAVRDQLIDWMRSQSSSYSAVATFTACIRPQNVPSVRGTPLSLKGLWGEEGSPILKLSVGETDVNEDLVRQWEQYLAGQFYDRHLDDDAYKESSIEDRQRHAFDDMIHVRRVVFVSKAVEQGKIPKVSKSNLRAVSEAANEVLNIGSVSADIRMQANGNRRVMLAGVANFIEYVVRDLELEWDLIGVGSRDIGGVADAAKRELRGSAIKSLYYRFLGSSRPGEVQPPVFDERVFDPVASVIKSGWSGRRLDPDGGTATVCRSCKDILILMGVYNACGNTISVWSEHAVQVRSVAAKCALLGLSSQEVYSTIENLIRAVGVRFAGVFDIDYFLPIYRREHSINGEERIIATDRCRRLLSVVIFMFNFLCERIKHNGLSDGGYSAADKELAYRGLVPPRVVDAFPAWLAKAAVIETWWIEAVQAGMEAGSLRTAFDKYCEEFVVKKRHGKVPFILTQAIARSAIAYIEYCLARHIRHDESELHDCYYQAKSDLQSIDNALRGVCERLRRGEMWGIPRNEPLRY